MTFETNKTFLVTGCAGFIGHGTAKELLKRGDTVIGIDSLNEYYDKSLKLSRVSDLERISDEFRSDFIFEKIDLTKKETLYDFLSRFKISSVCHLAAQAGVLYSLENPYSYINNNILATVNLLEVCKELEIYDVVFSSTSSVYGKSQDLPFNEDSDINSTTTVYSSSKRACELLCHTYNHLYGMKFRILRFFTVYGPWGRPDMALFKFTDKILNSETIEVNNFGKMSRDFTYIDDIVQGIILSLESEFEFEIFNLGNGNPQPLDKFIRLIEDNLKVKAKIKYLPMQKGEVQKTFADVSKAEKLLKYKPQFNIETGVSKFIKWYKSYYDR